MSVFRLGDACPLCGAPILHGQAYSIFSDFLPSWSSLAYVSGKAVHNACHDAWPFAKAFDDLMSSFELSQWSAQKHAMHCGYEFECDCDRLDPVWPNARADSLDARWDEHEARCEEEWATKYAGVPSSRVPTYPPPPPDPDEPVLQRLHPDTADAELRRNDEQRQPIAFARYP